MDPIDLFGTGPRRRVPPMELFGDRKPLVDDTPNQPAASEIDAGDEARLQSAAPLSIADLPTFGDIDAARDYAKSLHDGSGAKVEYALRSDRWVPAVYERPTVLEQPNRSDEDALKSLKRQRETGAPLPPPIDPELEQQDEALKRERDLAEAGVAPEVYEPTATFDASMRSILAKDAVALGGFERALTNAPRLRPRVALGSPAEKELLEEQKRERQRRVVARQALVLGDLGPPHRNLMVNAAEDATRRLEEIAKQLPVYTGELHILNNAISQIQRSYYAHLVSEADAQLATAETVADRAAAFREDMLDGALGDLRAAIPESVVTGAGRRYYIGQRLAPQYQRDFESVAERFAQIGLISSGDPFYIYTDKGLGEIEAALADLSPELRASFLEDLPELNVDRVETARADVEAFTEAMEEATGRFKIPSTPSSFARDYLAPAGTSLAIVVPAVGLSLFTGSSLISLAVAGFMGGGEGLALGTEAGLSRAERGRFALGYALAEAIPEYLQVGFFIKALREGIPKGFAGFVAHQAGLEASQESITEALQAGLDAEFINPDMTLREALDRIYHAFGVGALAGGALAGGFYVGARTGDIAAQGGRAIRRTLLRHRLDETQRDVDAASSAEALEQMAEATRKMRVRERDPETTSGWLENRLKADAERSGIDRSTMHIDAKAATDHEGFGQTLSDRIKKLSQVTGVSEEVIRQARRAPAGTIQVKTSEYLVRAADHPESQFFADIFSFEPDGETVRDRREARRAIGRLARGLTTETTEDAVSESLGRAPDPIEGEQELYDFFYRSLVRIDPQKASQAETQARIATAMFRRLAIDGDISLAELRERMLGDVVYRPTSRVDDALRGVADPAAPTPPYRPETKADTAKPTPERALTPRERPPEEPALPRAERRPPAPYLDEQARDFETAAASLASDPDAFLNELPTSLVIDGVNARMVVARPGNPPTAATPDALREARAIIGGGGNKAARDISAAINADIDAIEAELSDRVAEGEMTDAQMAEELRRRGDEVRRREADRLADAERSGRIQEARALLRSLIETHASPPSPKPAQAELSEEERQILTDYDRAMTGLAAERAAQSLENSPVKPIDAESASIEISAEEGAAQLRIQSPPVALMARRVNTLLDGDYGLSPIGVLPIGSVSTRAERSLSREETERKRAAVDRRGNISEIDPQGRVAQKAARIRAAGVVEPEIVQIQPDGSAQVIGASSDTLEALRLLGATEVPVYQVLSVSTTPAVFEPGAVENWMRRTLEEVDPRLKKAEITRRAKAAQRFADGQRAEWEASKRDEGFNQILIADRARLEGYDRAYAIYKTGVDPANGESMRVIKADGSVDQIANNMLFRRTRHFVDNGQLYAFADPRDAGLNKAIFYQIVQRAAAGVESVAPLSMVVSLPHIASIDAYEFLRDLPLHIRVTQISDNDAIAFFDSENGIVINAVKVNEYADKNNTPFDEMFSGIILHELQHAIDMFDAETLVFGPNDYLNWLQEAAEAHRDGIATSIVGTDAGRAALNDYRVAAQHPDAFASDLVTMMVSNRFPHLADPLQKIDKSSALFETRLYQQSAAYRGIVDAVKKNRISGAVMGQSPAQLRDLRGGAQPIDAELIYDRQRIERTANYVTRIYLDDITADMSPTIASRSPLNSQTADVEVQTGGRSHAEFLMRQVILNYEVLTNLIARSFQAREFDFIEAQTDRLVGLMVQAARELEPLMPVVNMILHDHSISPSMIHRAISEIVEASSVSQAPAAFADKVNRIAQDLLFDLKRVAAIPPLSLSVEARPFLIARGARDILHNAGLQPSDLTLDQINLVYEEAAKNADIDFAPKPDADQRGPQMRDRPEDPGLDLIADTLATMSVDGARLNIVAGSETTPTAEVVVERAGASDAVVAHLSDRFGAANIIDQGWSYSDRLLHSRRVLARIGERFVEIRLTPWPIARARDELSGAASDREALLRAYDEKLALLDPGLIDEMIAARRSEGFEQSGDEILRGRAVPRGGSYADGLTGFDIELTEFRDLSTFTHEVTHVVFEAMLWMAAQPNTPQIIRDDIAGLLKYAGVSPSQIENPSMRKKAHEAVADGVEVFLMEGKAPTPDLRGTFARISQWLKTIYQGMRERLFGDKPLIKNGVDAREYFGRLFATQAEIAAARNSTGFIELFEKNSDLGFAPSELETYRELVEAAQGQVFEGAISKATEQLKADQRAIYEDRLRVQMRKSGEVMRQSPVYAAFFRLIEGFEASFETMSAIFPFEDPAMIRAQPSKQIRAKISAEALRQAFPDLDLNTLPKWRGQKIYAEPTRRGGRIVDGGRSSTGVFLFEQVELAASAAGYSQSRGGAAQMIEDFRSMKPFAEAVRENAEAAIREFHPDFLDTSQASETVRDLLHSDATARMLEYEIKLLGDKAGARGITRKVARIIASDMLSETKVGDVRPLSYLQQERRLGIAAQREAAKLAKIGDKRSRNALVHFNALLRVRQQQMIAFELYRQSREIEDRVRSARRRYRGWSRQIKALDKRDKVKTNTIAPDYLIQMRGLFHRYNFVQMTGKERARQENFAAWVARMREEGREGELVEIPEHMLTNVGRIHYKDLTVDQFRGLMDTLENLAYLGGLKQELQKKQRLRERERKIDAMIEGIEKRAFSVDGSQPTDPSTPGRIVHDWIASFFLSGVDAATLAREQIDAGQEMGPAYEALIAPAQEGLRALPEAHIANTKALNEIDELLPIEDRRRADVKELVPGTDLRLSLNQRLAIALNMGTTSNRDAIYESPLFRGEAGRQRIDAVLGMITEAQWNWVQRVWDHIGSFRGRLGEVEKRITGVEPRWVDAAEVETRFGVLPGGYYPLRYADGNVRHGAPSDAITEGQFIEGGLARQTARTQTPAGFAKARVGSGGREVLLDLRVREAHINAVLYHIHLGAAVAEIGAIIRNQRFRAEMENAGRRVGLRELDKYLVALAEGEQAPRDFLERTMRAAKTNLTFSALAYSVPSAAINLSGITNTIGRLGLSRLDVVHGVREMAMNAASGWRDVYAESAVMRERARVGNKEISDAQRARSANVLAGAVGLVSRRGKRAVEAMVEYGFSLMTISQMPVDIATYYAARRRGLQMFVDLPPADRLKKAIEYAENIVEESQSAQSFVRLSSIERGQTSPTSGQQWAIRALSTLMSYMRTKPRILYGKSAQIGDAVRRGSVSETLITTANFVQTAVWIYSIEAAMVLMIRAALHGDWLGDDLEEDDTTWAEMLATETLKSVAGSFVILSSISAETQGFRGGGGIGALNATFGRLVQQAGQAEPDEAFIKALVGAGSMVTPFPGVAANRAIGAYFDEIEGEDVSPMTYLTGPKR